MLKFSLFVQLNEIDGPLDYEIIGASYCNNIDNIYEYTGLHDPTGITPITIRLKNNTSKSYILIKKLVVGDITLDNMQQWSTYILDDGNPTTLTHGWIDRNGEYRLKIRYSPAAQNYISYFLSLCPKS